MGDGMTWRLLADLLALVICFALAMFFLFLGPM